MAVTGIVLVDVQGGQSDDLTNRVGISPVVKRVHARLACVCMLCGFQWMCEIRDAGGGGWGCSHVLRAILCSKGDYATAKALRAACDTRRDQKHYSRIHVNILTPAINEEQKELFNSVRGRSKILRGKLPLVMARPTEQFSGILI